MTTPMKLVAAVLLLAASVTLATASDHRSGRRGEHDDEEEHEHEGRERGRRERSAGDRGRLAPAASSTDPGAEALYRKECGACHVAFPPRMLSADAHRRTLAGLEKHFGQNAELDAPVRERLERWLVANGGEARGDATLRLTEQRSFQRKHREVRRETWARASVRSPANCAACHPGAADWDFDEDRVKIPR
jgi:hypothetical protein